MKQTQLFGEPKELTIVLHEPLREQWEPMQAMLESRCNKDELLHYADAFTPWLGKYPQIMRATNDGHVVTATECTSMLKSNSPKWVIAQGVALILSDEQNMQTYISSLSPEMKALWRTVLANIFVSQKTAKEILHTSDNLLGESRTYYYSNSVKWNRRELGWFTTASFRSAKPSRWGYREYERFITVSAFIHGLFFPHFFPEMYEDDNSLAELPSDNWTTYNFEAESFSAFNLFCGLFQQDELPLRAKGINTSDLKRAQKKLALRDFFSADDPCEYHQNLRAFNYMKLLALNEHFRPIEKKGKQKKQPTLQTYEDTLREMLRHLDRYGFYFPAILYPHIKGLRKQFTDYGRDVRLCTVATTLLSEEPERWISVNDILLKIYQLESDGSTSRYTTLVYHPNDERDYGAIINLYSGHTIIADSYTQEFGYTGLQSFMFLLCSLGVVEIALSDDEHRNISPFDRLDYVRLTPLGCYALGVTDEYEAPEQEHIAYFELDPDRLIIRSLVEPNPYAQLLMDTSQPISRNRFETSALSFLANCHKRDDVESKISIFRQFISNELPPLWEQFFQTLLQHCHPLTEDKTAYKHYTLDPQNRDLIQLITNDPVLRKITIRAEGYRTMVKNEDIQKFETQLKKHGYLL